MILSCVVISITLPRTEMSFYFDTVEVQLFEIVLNDKINLTRYMRVKRYAVENNLTLEKMLLQLCLVSLISFAMMLLYI